MNETNNWKEIEEEFRKEYVVKSNAGTGLLRYTDADKIINFFKLYFQELEEKAWMYDNLSK